MSEYVVIEYDGRELLRVPIEGKLFAGPCRALIVWPDGDWEVGRLSGRACSPEGDDLAWFGGEAIVGQQPGGVLVAKNGTFTNLLFSFQEGESG